MRKTAVVTYLAVGVADVVQIDADDAIPVKKDTGNKLSFHVNMEGNKSISTRTTRVESLFFHSQGHEKEEGDYFSSSSS